MSRDGEAHASGSLVSPIPPSGVAARPQRRTAAAEPTLLTFASQQGDDFCDGGPDVVMEEVMEGEEEQDKGIGAWGDICHTHPLEESSGRIVSPCVLF